MRYLVILSFLVVSAYGSEGWSKCKRLFPDPKDLPWQPENAVRICREGELAIVYDKDMMNPAISNYHITPKQANSIISGRESDFYQDPDLDKMGIDQLKSDGASLADSSHGGEWDRGHLAPNRIMSYTLKARKSTYTMANIAPQASKFNRSPWKNLETRVVKWIKSNNALHIITGVAYKDRNDVKRESDNGVRPDYFWKVLCDVSNGQAVGFYGANKDKTKSTTDFVTITEIEEMYGGKLFPRNLCKVDTVSPEYWWGNGGTPKNTRIPRKIIITSSKGNKSSTAVQLTSVLSLMFIWSVTITAAMWGL
eukprot:Tbor_TRINITY_DN6016_c0_g2::TRINITY_DN6016_c0_g2_i2::g.10796::m.10796/K01173/ENDOG; endonuclease G, mitochondrial